MSLPYPILLLLAVVLYLAVGVGYVFRTPLWQVQDEPAHFNYVNYIKEGKGVPELKKGDYPGEYIQELIQSKFPPDKSISTIEYEYHQPPLFYLLAALPLKLGSALGVEDQVRLLRIFSLILGLVPAVAIYFIARSLFPLDDFIEAAAPFFVLIPQHVAIAASVNSDIAAEAVLSVLLLGLVQLIADDRIFGIDFSSGIFKVWGLLGVILGITLITKTAAYISIPMIIVALFIVWWPVGGDIRLWRGWVVSLAFVLGIALIVSGMWFWRNVSIYGGLDFFGLERHRQVVNGQSMSGSIEISTATAFITTTFESFWLRLGWMALPAEGWVYPPLVALTGVAICGLLVYVVRLFIYRYRADIKEVRGLVLLSLTVVFAFFALSLYDFQFVQPQGRYLFTAFPAFALLFALGVSEVFRKKYRWIALGVIVVGLTALNLRAIIFYLPMLAA